MKFSVGDHVVEKKNIKPFTSHSVLRIISILNGDYLAVYYGQSFKDEVDVNDWEIEPGSREWREGILRLQEKDLMSFEEYEIELKNLESEGAILEQEFRSVKDKIQINLKQASQLVEEAGLMLKTYNKDLVDMQSDCKPLYLALKNAGWSHSSMSC